MQPTSNDVSRDAAPGECSADFCHGLPARHVLRFVEVQGDAAFRVEAREPAGVLRDQPAEVGDGETGEPLVLEQQQQLRFRPDAGPQARRAALRQKRGLAAAAYADDGERLARNGRQPHVPAREAPGAGGQGLVQLRPQDLS